MIFNSSVTFWNADCRQSVEMLKTKQCFFFDCILNFKAATFNFFNLLFFQRCKLRPSHSERIRVFNDLQSTDRMRTGQRPREGEGVEIRNRKWNSDLRKIRLRPGLYNRMQVMDKSFNFYRLREGILRKRIIKI